MKTHSLVTSSMLDDNDYHGVHFPFGQNDDGELISWHPASTPHRRITGAPGSGRSELARSFAKQAARAGWAVHILARYKYEYGDLAADPNTTVAVGIDEQAENIHHLWTLMRDRFDTGRRDHTPVLVVIDTYDDLLAAADPRSPREEIRLAKDCVDALIRLGRAAKIHVLAVMDEPPVNYDIIYSTRPIDLIDYQGRVSQLHRLVQAATGAAEPPPLYRSKPSVPRKASPSAAKKAGGGAGGGKGGGGTKRLLNRLVRGWVGRETR
ncbi:ATP-binding protein [Mycobacterium hubeiense]|uniref:ATP-binding protein n=1 Tax=Mycobacterium hubeiense TaxID=1867256 RepID=UPI000C7F7751|nr:ATP-binding protein [Mycobacterium sp. QGD 101]